MSEATHLSCEGRLSHRGSKWRNFCLYSARKVWSGFQEGGIGYGTVVNKGDIVGAMLDLENGSMTFSINGVSCGVAFTESDHGSNPSVSSFIKEGAAGADWDRGFYPCASLDNNESMQFNFGQEPLRYSPEGYYSVMQVASGLVGEDHGDISSKELAKPVDLSVLNMSTKLWSSVGSELLGPDPAIERATICGILPSLRLQYQIGVKDMATGKIEQQTFTSVKAIRPNTWVHVCIRTDEDSVDMYLNGGEFVSRDNE